MLSTSHTPLLPHLSEVDEVLRRANDTEYGLASGVFTRDINKALYVSEKLNAGTVFINTYNKTDVASPFGGFKQSGFGKDLGKNPDGGDSITSAQPGASGWRSTEWFNGFIKGNQDEAYRHLCCVRQVKRLSTNT